MANIKITDLDAYADPKSTDVLPAVDVTNDETKKVSIADLMENAGAGAEATPGIAFDGDPDTGIYRPAADQLAISTGGTQRLLIDDSGVVTVAGDLTVNGTTTTVNSTTVTVDDKNIELGSVGTPTDTTADGGGITLKGATDKTLNWVNSTDSWTSSENIDLASGKTYKIAGTDVLSATALGSGVTGSSLTSVGTITTGVWNGTALTADAIGADAINGSKIADDSIDSEHYVDGSIDNVHVSASAAIAGTKISADFGAQNLTVDTNVLFVDATNDRVGIGSASPEGLLHLAASSEPSLYFEDTGSSNTLSRIYKAGSGLFINSRHTTAGQIVFNSENSSGVVSERARIDGSGRLLVGINTTSATCTAILQGSSAGATSGGSIILARGEETPADGSAIGTIFFAANNHVQAARISSARDGGTWTAGSSQPSRLAFATTADGAASPTERMRIEADGDIRMGTDTDYAWIRPYDSSTGDLIISSNHGSTGGDNDSAIVFRPRGTERMRLDKSGRLLVGTSDDVSGDSTNVSVQIVGPVDNTYGALHLCRNDSTIASSNPIGRIEFRSNDENGTYESHARIEVQAEGGIGDGDKPGRMIFYTTPDASATPFERMRIASNGDITVDTDTFFVDAVNNRVGIGATSPLTSLHISSASDTAITLASTDVADTNEQFVFMNNGGNFNIRTHESDGTFKSIDYIVQGGASGATGHRWRIENDEKMRIDSDGRLLVGTNSDISGGAASANIQAVGGGGGNITVGRDDTTVGADTVIGGMRFFSNATDGNYDECARIVALSDTGGYTSTSKPTRIEFRTTASGAVSPTARMTIKENGNVGIGITDPQSKLDVLGDGSLSGSAFEYLYATDSGIKVTGNESAIDILSTSGGSHASSLLLRGNDKGYGIVNDPSNDVLSVVSFTASADDFSVHANGSNVSAHQKIVSFRETGGITFNGDTADINTLDDYEQGTWVPDVRFGGVATGVTYTEQEGTYIKIGNFVWASMVVTLSNNGTGSGNITVSLPFASGSEDATRGTGNLSFAANFLSLNSSPVLYISGDNQSTCTFRHLDSSSGSGGTLNTMTNSNVSNTGQWRAAISYTTF